MAIRLVSPADVRGLTLLASDRLGTVNAFNHSHLDVGWAGEERNPFQFRLPHFRDTTPPVIARSGVRLFAEDGRPITRTERGRLIVEGRVEVVVDAWDQVDVNAARRRLGLYSIGHQVLHPDASPAPGFEAPRQTIVFDRLPSDAAASLLFAAGSGIPHTATAPRAFSTGRRTRSATASPHPAVGTRARCARETTSCGCGWPTSAATSRRGIAMSRSRSAPQIRPPLIAAARMRQGRSRIQR